MNAQSVHAQYTNVNLHGGVVAQIAGMHLHFDIPFTK